MAVVGNFSNPKLKRYIACTVYNWSLLGILAACGDNKETAADANKTSEAPKEKEGKKRFLTR
jgi:hypothetical protein